MGAEDVISMANHMFWIAFLVSMPLLLTALVVGVSISIVQTVTGVQEMTLTFVPKVMGVVAALMMFLPWMASILEDYAKEILALLAGG
jgi:flagellar biosynthetic protein FliQ